MSSRLLAGGDGQDGAIAEPRRAAADERDARADAVEVARTGRTGVYDIVVTNRAGARVALVRGRSARLGDRTVLPVAAEEKR